MIKLFRKTPVIDPESAQWLLECFKWCLENFNAQVFFNETILVLPSNKHFPGKANSTEQLASLIFEQVKEYAGLAHWPTRIVEDSQIIENSNLPLLFDGHQRGQNLSLETEANVLITVPYAVNQLNKPEVTIASFAHILSHYLAGLAKTPPPGGKEYWPFSTEVLAVFLGFGIMLANSAYTYRGGCGSCYNPLSERSAFLSQDEVIYALAIFCTLKQIPLSQTTPHLKSYLRPLLKKSIRELEEVKTINSLKHFNDIQV